MTEPYEAGMNPDDPSSSAFDPTIDPSLDDTARRVASALNAHVSSIEPSNDAYARLATSVASARTGTEERSSLSERLWRGGGLSGGRGGQLGLVASMAAVAALGVGAVVIARSEPPGEVTASSFEAAIEVPVVEEPEATPTTLRASPTDSEPVFTSPETGTETTVEAEVVVGRTPEQAVDDFLMAVDPGGRIGVAIDGATATITALDTNGQPIGVIAMLQLVEEQLETGSITWRVQEATSPFLAFDRPAGQQTLTNPFVRVAGVSTGVGTEGVEVTLISTFDGRVLAEVTAADPNAPTGDQAPDPAEAAQAPNGQATTVPADQADDSLAAITSAFSARVPLVNHTEAWLVARPAAVGDGVATPFTATLVSVEAAPEATAFRVIRIPNDDPDGGLRLRATPGLDAATIEVLPVGTVVTRRAELPVDTGQQLWWPVSVDGTDGWVAAQHLGGGQVAGLSGVEAAIQLEAAATLGGERPNSDAWPFAPDRDFGVVVDGVVYEIEAASLASPDGWSTPIGGLDRSLLDVLGPSSIDTLDQLEVDETRAFVEPGSAAVADTWFGGLPVVTVRVPSAQGDRLHHWVLDGRANRNLVVIGVIVENAP